MNKKIKEATLVLFRKDKRGGDVMAIFPYQNAGEGYITSYEHIGQHSACSWDYVREDTMSASREEYEDLKNELQGIGYDNIIVINRLPVKRKCAIHYNND